MDGACRAYGGEDRREQDFGRKRGHLEEPGVDVGIILKWIFRK